MPRFAANLSFLFPDLPFLERFAAAKDAGFAAVEFHFPYEYPPETLAAEMRRLELRNVLFNLPPGDWAKGERGLAALPGREREFKESVAQALDYAHALDCPLLHVMAGVPAPDADPDEALDCYVNNLRFASRRAAGAGKRLAIEPINRRDMPGYFLASYELAAKVIAMVGADNLGLLLDLYHCQILEGDLARHIRSFAPQTFHIQIAGVPDRGEPDQGEVNYPYLFNLLDELPYEGWIGLEYRPRAGTREGLGWLRALGG